MKFPGIPDPFPACAAKSADCGQNLQESRREKKNSLLNSLQQGIPIVGTSTKFADFMLCLYGLEPTLARLIDSIQPLRTSALSPIKEMKRMPASPEVSIQATSPRARTGRFAPGG